MASLNLFYPCKTHLHPQWVPVEKNAVIRTLTIQKNRHKSLIKINKLIQLRIQSNNLLEAKRMPKYYNTYNQVWNRTCSWKMAKRSVINSNKWQFKRIGPRIIWDLAWVKRQRFRLTAIVTVKNLIAIMNIVMEVMIATVVRKNLKILEFTMIYNRSWQTKRRLLK